MEHLAQDNPGAAYSLTKLGVQLIVEDHRALITSLSPGTINTLTCRQEAAKQAEMKKMLEITPLRREGKVSGCSLWLSLALPALTV